MAPCYVAVVLHCRAGRICVCVCGIGMCVCICVCGYVTAISWMHGSVASTHCAAKEQVCSTGTGGEPRPAEDLRMQLDQVGNDWGGALMTSGSFTMMAGTSY